MISELIAKAQVLLEALPYLQSFRGSTFVIKYGGSFMDDPDPVLRARVAGDIAFLAAVGIHAVVVHGGGKAITRAMQEAGLEAKFVNGLRVTDEATVEVVRRTLNEQVNRDVCEMIAEHRGKPRSMPGEQVLLCRKVEKDDKGNPIDLGYVGDVTEVKVKLIKKALAEGFTPVISPVALGYDGKPYNVNADVAASRVAAALRARRLVYLSDVPGLLENPEDPATLISSVRESEIAGLKARGVISKGMLPKIDSALRALREGVHRVHFIDGRMPHSLLLEIFTDKGIGTEIVHG
ncbi:MAG: acetylglutamate kinase [Verrucomicrobia bacterium]|nr:MAG: acetylglutamate kinase [Verrucomicrobiota bacterium]